MDDLDEFPGELAPLLADLLRAAASDDLLGRLPADQREAEVTAALQVSARPAAEMITLLAKANEDRTAAQREMLTNPNEASAALAGRAASTAEGARFGLVDLRRHVLERARFRHTADVMASRARAAGHAVRLAGPKGLLAAEVRTAKALDDALEALRVAADAHLASHEASCTAARDFAADAIRHFEPPFQIWSFERRGDIREAFGVAQHVVLEAVIERIDGIFRRWGTAWTSNTQFRYIGRGRDLADAQQERNAKAYALLCGTAREFGVEVPDHA